MSSRPLSASQKRGLASAAEMYHGQLDEEALAYLEARGLGTSHAIETLRLGVVRSPRPEHAMMRDRLAIPFIGPKGNVYDIRFRCMNPHDHKDSEVKCPKYLGVDGVETRVYNARALVADTDYIFVCEGELDAATLTVCGWPAIGLPGANSWKKHYPRLLAGFSKVILVADGDVRKDPAKQTAAEKLVSTFRRALPSSGHVILCESGDDVNSVFVREGKEGLVSLLKGEEEDE